MNGDKINSIFLRKMDDEDINIFKKWLYAKHVAKWYENPDHWLYEIERRNGEFSWIHHFIVEVDSIPIGVCQYYEYQLSGETWHGDINIDSTYSIDYMIGDAKYLKKGYGKKIVMALEEKIVNDTNAIKIIVQPEKENLASRNTLLSANYDYNKQNDVYYKNIK